MLPPLSCLPHPRFNHRQLFIVTVIVAVIASSQASHAPNVEDTAAAIIDGDSPPADSSATDAAAAPASPPETAVLQEAAEAHRDEMMRKMNDGDADDTDADDDAWPANSGPSGRGPPMSVGRFERQRPICDGAGLCSPGHWPPWSRPLVRDPRILALRAALQRAVLALDGPDGQGTDRLFTTLAQGEATESPFPDALLDDLVGYTLSLFDDDGHGGARPRPADVPQPVRVRLLQAILRAVGDPDPAGMEHFARGIRIGVGVKLPRTPAVYSRKTRWRLPEQSGADADAEVGVEAVWLDNYRTAKENLGAIEQQLDDHVSRGLADRVDASEAELRYPGLRVASLGAVEKVGSPGDVRIVLDGSRGVGVNTAIRVRDQDRCPTAADVKRQQREQDTTRRGLGLAVDVSEAHRLPRVHRDDWRFQACRARTGGPVTVYKVGVFGIASIAYWWSRMGGAAIRALTHTAGEDLALWTMLMADDVKLEATSTQPRRSLIWALLFLSVLGLPLAWKKVHGGTFMRWIGYEVDVVGLKLGITESRAQWAVDWCSRVARDGRCRSDDFRAALGRLGFVTGALEFERPFLAPLFSHLAHARGDGLLQLPLYVTTVLLHLAARFAARRLYPSAVRRGRNAEHFRVDARADGETIGVGGWLPSRNHAGRLDTRCSRWFAVSLTRTTAPWAYCRGEPFRTIAALEAFGVLLALMAFADDLQTDGDVTLQVAGATDNRGNAYVLNRLMTTRFPLCAVVMETAAQMERKNIRVSLDWCPRDLNSEADALSNGDVSSFTPELRVELDVANINWIVLNKLMDHGVAHELSKSHAKRAAAPKTRKKAKWARLRITDPW